jgi:tetratricopeptide (TPR) repeat protein
MVLLAAIAAAVVMLPSSVQDSKQMLAVQHMRAGQQALQIERWEEAEREFKTAIEFDPLLELAHYGLGQSYMGQKRYAESVQVFRRCREVFHNNESARMADNVDAQRRLDDQIQSLRDEKHALQTGRVHVQNLQAKLNQLDTQIAGLETQRRRDHNSASQTPAYISTALGSALFRTGAFPDAEQEWRNAVAVDSSIGEVHNNLAVVYMLTGRFDEAEREVKLAEKNGFRVSEGLKQDIKARKGKG